MMRRHDSGRRQDIINSLSTDERTVRLAAFHIILARTPASFQHLVERTRLAPAAVARTMARLVSLGLLVVNDAGDVVGSWGLTLTATSHRLRLAEGEYFTWCAEDAVGIPAALGADATVTSSCFHCGQHVVVAIEHGAVAWASPKEARLWLAEAEIGHSMVGCT